MPRTCFESLVYINLIMLKSKFQQVISPSIFLQGY